MAYCYTKYITADSTNFPKALAAISIPAGNWKCTAVPFPSQGRITDLKITQTGGTKVSFAVELLTSKIPYPTGAAVIATGPTTSVSKFRILPQQSSSAGDDLELEEDSDGFNYRNADGTFTVNQRFIYLIIFPEGAAGTTTWEGSITCET